jgi:hypothetical protein
VKGFLGTVTLFEGLCVGVFCCFAYAVAVQNVQLAMVTGGTVGIAIWGRLLGQD